MSLPLGERPGSPGTKGTVPVAYWYRLSGGGPRVIQASDEEAARAAVLERHPDAAGERISLEPYRI